MEESLRRLLPALLCVTLFGLSCATVAPPVPSDAISLQDDVYIQELSAGIWRHVSYRLFPGTGLFPSNGLIAAVPGGAIVVDTAWTPEQTAAVLDWTVANVGAVQAVVITHAHDDRLGGLAELQQRAIPTYALAETVALAASAGWPPIDNSVPSGFSLASLGIAGELYHPGAGHTVDNTTVWLEDAGLLVGGCLIRSATATTLGNITEADLQNWPVAVENLEQRYPQVTLVLPGHGDPGGIELLTHTRDLFQP